MTLQAVFTASLRVLVSGLFSMPVWASGAPAIVEAARYDDLAAVTRQIANRADVNVRSNDGTTALGWAAMRTNLDVAQALLKAGADPNLANTNGVTPLSLAIVNGSGPIVKLLLDAKANPNLARDSGETPLMTAARLGRLQDMQMLLAHGANPNARETKFQQTVLMWATGYPEAVRLLLDHKADVNAATKSWAVKARRYGNGFATLGKTGIPWVSEGEYDTNVGGYTALHFAVGHRNLDSVRLLLDAGADINKAGADGATPLLLSLYSFETSSGGIQVNLPIASFLLDHGAKVNAPDLAGYTPLHGVMLAIAAVSKPAGSRGGNRRRDTPAAPKVNPNPVAARKAAGVVARGGGAGTEASVSDLMAMAKRLLDSGADPNHRTLHPTPGPIGDTRVNPAPPGSSPYHIAAATNNLELIRILEAHGADPNLISQEGHSPFTVAIKTGNLDVVKEMASHGADLSARYNPTDMIADPVESIARPRKGQTAIHVAVVAQQIPMIEYLHSLGVPLEAKNEANETPLALADAQERYRYALAKQGGREVPRSTAISDAIKLLSAQAPQVDEGSKVAVID